MVRFLFIIVVALSFYSCVQDDNGNLDSYGDLDNATDTSAFDYRVISVPSPTQIATVVKILDLDYESAIIDSSLNAKKNKSVNSKSALMGVYIVDMGYSAIYEKPKETEEFLIQISKLFFDLGIDSPNAYNNFERLKSNINNKDSLFVIMLEIQHELQNYFAVTEQNDVSVSVLSGVYIEGLYISSKVYVEQLYKKPLIQSYIKKQIGMMMLQQEILLNNIIELHETFNTGYKIVDDLKLIRTHFDNMKISYSYNDKRKRIDNVNCDYKLIVDLYNSLDKIRNGILGI